MPVRTAVAALTLAFCFSAGSANAQGLSTERLVELCRDPASAAWREIGQWVCPSYIREIIDGARLQAMHTAGSVEEHRRLMQFCVPETASGADAIGVGLRYVEAHPEIRSEAAAVTVYVALAAAWPCERD